MFCRAFRFIHYPFINQFNPQENLMALSCVSHFVSVSPRSLWTTCIKTNEVDVIAIYFDFLGRESNVTKALSSVFQLARIREPV